MATHNHDEGMLLTPITIQPTAISCSDEELVEVELDALQQGAEQARKDGASYLTSMQAISKAASDACERSLRLHYLPLDERKFREVFMLSWCAGYRSETRITERLRQGVASH